MAIKEVTMYTVICDGCGADANEDGEFAAYTDAGSALDVAINSDWVEYEGKHYCEDCGVPPCATCAHLYGEHDYEPGPCLECECKLYTPAVPVDVKAGSGNPALSPAEEESNG